MVYARNTEAYPFLYFENLFPRRHDSDTVVLYVVELKLKDYIVDFNRHIFRLINENVNMILTRTFHGSRNGFGKAHLLFRIYRTILYLLKRVVPQINFLCFFVQCARLIYSEFEISYKFEN